MTNISMTNYYAKRAAEYEQIYLKPERQKDLRKIQTKLMGSFVKQDVLEIACGTGYWTQFACRSPNSIMATDYNNEVINIARKKDYGNCSVIFQQSDAYVLADISGPFSGALAGFWLSHVPESRLDGFLQSLHSKLCHGACVIMFDNRFVEGSNTPISRTDKEGNTYQIRELSDGSQHEVLKNFPEQKEFLKRIAPISERCEFSELEYFWMAEYILK